MKELEKRNKQKEVLDSIRKSLAIESLILGFRCSTTSKGFTVILERKSRNKKYVVKNIEKRTEMSPTSVSTPANESTEVNIDEVDYTSIKCPFCAGGPWAMVQCHCGGLSCSGGIERKDGLHVCPWCGSKESISGELVT